MEDIQVSIIAHLSQTWTLTLLPYISPQKTHLLYIIELLVLASLIPKWTLLKHSIHRCWFNVLHEWYSSYLLHFSHIVIFYRHHHRETNLEKQLLSWISIFIILYLCLNYLLYLVTPQMNMQFKMGRIYNFIFVSTLVGVLPIGYVRSAVTDHFIWFWPMKMPIAGQMT
jgi:hypothetical protein